MNSPNSIQNAGLQSDKRLLSRIRKGENDAATELYLRYADRIQRLAKSQLWGELTSRLDPEDVVQSVFRTFFRRAAAGHYDIPEGDELWKLLLVISLNKVRSLGQFHRAAKRNIDRTVPLSESSNLPGETRAHAFSLLSQTVREAMERLGETERRIVELRIDGCPIQEITHQVQRAHRTVERVLQRFRQELRLQLEQD